MRKQKRKLYLFNKSLVQRLVSSSIEKPQSIIICRTNNLKFFWNFQNLKLKNYGNFSHITHLILILSWKLKSSIFKYFVIIFKILEKYPYFQNFQYNQVPIFSPVYSSIFQYEWPLWYIIKKRWLAWVELNIIRAVS